MVSSNEAEREKPLFAHAHFTSWQGSSSRDEFGVMSLHCRYLVAIPVAFYGWRQRAHREEQRRGFRET